MNTPTHALVSLFVLGRRATSRETGALVAGAIAPDVPMFVMFVWARFIAGRPQGEIWGDIYYQRGWQHAIDAAHSVPIALALVAVSLWRQRAGGRETLWSPVRLFALSGLLHTALDFPVHHDDGHRHFWPLSPWRFDSPISYWDDCCYGSLVSLGEVTAMLVVIVLLWRRYTGRWGRVALGVTGFVYTAGLASLLVRARDFPWLGALLGGGRD